MQRLNIVLVGQGSARLKTISYVPFALKAYLDFHLAKSLKDNVKIKVLDFEYDAMPQTMTSRILDNEPDIVGFSTYLWNYNQFLECARNIKTIKKNTLIIFGGPQVAAMEEKIMVENPYVDIISSNHESGEIAFLDIVEAVYYKRDLSTVNNIYYYDSKRDLIKTPLNLRPMDYKTVPSPYSGNDELFDEEVKYMAILETSRGCPRDCGYCFFNKGKRNIEYFSLDRVLHDIEVVYSNPRVNFVYFADSNLLSDAKRAETIIKHIIKQKSQVRTDFEIDFSCLKETTAKLLASLPEFRFFMGLQSSNPNVSKYIGSTRPSPEIFMKKLRELKQWVPDVKLQVDLMLGLPGDDLDGFIQTLNFVLSLEPLYIVLNYPVYLLPGSRFFQNRDVWGLRYNPEPPFSIIQTPTFPQKDIEKALRIAIWVQIFTYYYPAIAKFFYNVARLDGIRVERLLRWITTIERKINLFGLCGNLTDVAISSTTEWNRLKKDLLEKASTSESASLIYSSICELEKSTIESPLAKNIHLGCDVFEYMIQQRIDAIEFDAYELLPSNIIDKSDSITIKDLFSVYRK